MQYEWLAKGQSKDLIIFFNGFGMDKTCIAHLQKDNAKSGKFDCLHICRYQDAELPHFDFAAYGGLYLVAWSLGVYMSAALRLPWTKKTAFCGTGNPVDLKEGIPPKIYRLTMNSFSEKSKLLFSEKTGFPMDGSRSVSDLQAELYAVQNAALPKNGNFDTAFIAAKDSIFPPANQKNYWQKHARTVCELNCGHYPFHLFPSWQEILDA